MASGGRMYNKHFFFSNRLFQLICGLRPDQSQNDQLLSLIAIIFYILPIIFHQFYQLFTSEVLMQFAVRVLQKIMGSIVHLVAYSTTYFNFVKMKILVSDLNNNFKEVCNEVDLAFLEEYIKQSKLYAYIVLGILNGYAISIIAPCVVKVCLYFLGTLDENQLSLLLPVNSVSKAGVKYFGLLIYQMVAVIIVVIVGAVSFSGYLIFVLFACYQFRVLIFKIRHPFEINLKYMRKDCCFRTPQEEWDWIIDVINRYKKVTEQV